MGRRRVSCHACAAIKTICSKESPCSRCSRLFLPCSLQVGTHDVGSGVKRRYPRTTSGCSTCRQRRKKCDEQQPVCGDCRRLGLPCGFQQSRLPTEQHLSPQSTLADERGSLPEASYLQEAPAEWIALIEDGDLGEHPRPAHLGHSSALHDFPITFSRQDEAAMSTFYPPLALSNLIELGSNTLKDWSIGERYLLNHYLQSVSRSLVVVDDSENPWLRVVTPKALENPTVSHALLALSAAHLGKVYPAFLKDLVDHRSRALQGLKAELQSSRDVLPALMTTMLLCITEVRSLSSIMRRSRVTDRF